MTQFLKNYWVILGMFVLPLIANVNTNHTLDVLFVVGFWILLFFHVIGALALFFFGLLAESDPSHYEMSPFEADKIRKQSFQWRVFLIGGTILAVLIYVEWTVAAVIYFLSLLFVIVGANLLRKALIQTKH